MEAKIIENLENGMAVKDNEVFIWQSNGISKSSVIFATRKWADAHREELKKIIGYCDFAYNKPHKPAQIQVFLTAEDALHAIQKLI